MVVLTEVEIEARVQPCDPTVLDYILCCLESALILVALCNIPGGLL